MSAKAQLKAVGEAIKQGKWDNAVEGAIDVVSKDPKNYHAHIFLAFALDKKNKLAEAETTYLTATNLKKDPQAWQGLVKIYEKTLNFRGYQNAALKLSEIFHDAGDMYKCQDVVDKFIDFVRANGDRQQLVDALDLILPESPIYPLLEGRLPHPASTYQTQAQIVETEEKKRINTLIGERRTRIGARLSEVTLEVKREVYHGSRLGYVYGQLINWATDDDVRRTYEEKLLQYCHDRLLVWPPGEQKTNELATVLKLAKDMVIIKHPYKLAWDITIDWNDYSSICEWDVTILRDFCRLFPDSDLQRVLTGFLTSTISPFPRETEESLAAEKESDQKNANLENAEEESSDDDDGGVATTYVPLTEEDRLVLMVEGISGTSSLFAHRLMGEYYQHLEEHESNAELMHKALTHLKEERFKTGLDFRNTEDVFCLYLGTALVFYQSPRHHQEAKNLFEKVLSHDASSTPALLGVGLIYEEEEEYDEAIDFLSRAMARDLSIRIRAEAAWVKALKGDYENSKDELEACVPLIASKGAGSKELLAQTQYRLGFCIWNLDTSKSARKSRTGAYAHFLDALKNSLNYAPAYTSLGLYYADYAKDKKRARQCFQKAIELSPSEVLSAERLARSFADEGDWARVELVAQRVVDSGKVKPPPGSKRKGISWPLAALGVAELNKQDFHKAIVSFQAALRISPSDYHSWVGLAESYFSSGRYIAATRAIVNAQKLEETAESIAGDTWFTKFMLANIKRDVGEFDEALQLFRNVLDGRAAEEGVAIAMMQTLVESSWDSLGKGFFGKSIKSAAEVINLAKDAPAELKYTFNYWKAIGDSCSIFSSIQSQVTDFPTDLVVALLDGDDTSPEYETLREVDGVGIGIIQATGKFPDDERIGVELTRCLQASILAHKRALYVSANEIHAQAVAYYNLGWAEYRAHACLPQDLRARPSRYLKASVQSFKRAIELEAGNSEFWNSLGVVTSEMNPAVSQHSFVRCLHLNERSARSWSNLGVLALLQNDLKFAHESFTRAQSTDPEYSHAWLGQGLIALLLGNVKEARGLFSHAMEISDSSSVPTRKHFSVSMFDHILTCPPNMPITDIIQPIFALSQLRGLRPQDLPCSNLWALFQERAGDTLRVVETLDGICGTVEADFEATESPEALKRFALAKTDLARSYLAAGSYDKAIEAAELALQLSSDESDNELTAEERKKARLSAHLTLGLAQYYSENIQEAVTCFDAVLEESDENPDAVCLLAQVLWATGEEEARERAREALYGVIEKSSNHTQSVLLLGVIAILDGDEETLDAVVTELETFRASVAGVTATEHAQIGEVLRAIVSFSEESSEERVMSQAQTDVILHPHLPHGWSELAVLASEEGESANAAAMALRVARKGVPPRGHLAAGELAKAYAGTGHAADAQSAIIVAPWESCGWSALGDVVTGLVGE